MPTIEQFTQDARALLNSLPAQTGDSARLAHKLNEACELLLDARLSAMSLSVLKEEREKLNSLLSESESARMAGVLKMAIRVYSYDIAKLEKVGVYYGV